MNNFLLMIQPVLAQAARDVLRTLGMWLLAQGVLTSGNEQAFIGACMTLLGILWGWFVTSGYIKLGNLLKRSTGQPTVADAKVAAQLSPQVKAVGSLLLIGAVTAALTLGTDPAHAQGGTRAATKAPVSKTAAQANPLLVLQQFTVTDLQNALADAQAQTPPDLTSANCYQALIPLVQNANSSATGLLPKSLGAFQLLQKTRDAKALIASLQSPTGPLQALNIACAPLVVDTQNTLIQLGILSGAVAATGGITLPIALPALGAL